VRSALKRQAEALRGVPQMIGKREVIRQEVVRPHRRAAPKRGAPLQHV